MPVTFKYVVLAASKTQGERSIMVVAGIEDRRQYFLKKPGASFVHHLAQVVLGVFTVLHAAAPHSFLWLVVAHQFVAMLILALLV